MYDDLIKAIRQNTCHFDACGMCPKRNALCLDRIALQAADAIEELSHNYEKLAEDFNGAVELLHKRTQRERRCSYQSTDNSRYPLDAASAASEGGRVNGA